MSLFSNFKNSKKAVTQTTSVARATVTTSQVEETLIADEKPTYKWSIDEMWEINLRKVKEEDMTPAGLLEKCRVENIETPKLEDSMTAAMEEVVESRNKTPASAGEGRVGMFGSEKQQIDTGISSLQTSEDAFRIKTATELSHLEKTKKFVNGLLNKLTPEKYDVLSQQLTSREEILNDESAMNLTIELIFDRAANQPSFCEMYASLSKRISDAEKLLKRGEDLKFRNQFLKVVQNEFERCKEILARIASGTSAQSQTDESAQTDRTEEERTKKRQLGNVQFVGELYKAGMLTNKVIHWVIPEILFKKEEGVHAGSEEIEVLCKLLNTVGKEMEARAKNSTTGGKSDFSAHIDKYFAELEKLSHNSKFEKRIQFSIINTIEARAKGWPQKVGTAKKLKELEKEAENAERNKLAGHSTVSHSGESNAWGSGATVHKSVGGKKKEEKAKAAKKNAAKDEWQTTGTSKKGSKNTAKQAGGKGPAPQQPQATKSNAYSSIQSGDKKKKKVGKDKKEKKQSRDKDDDEKKARDKPPMEIDGDFRAKVGQRALDCMMESDKEASLKEDMAHYEEYDFENLRPVIVMEVLRAIAIEKEEESCDMLANYLTFLRSTSYFKRDDIMRGISYFICSSAMEDLGGDYPKAYPRAAVALKKLLPSDPQETDDYSGYKEINSVFRNGCRMIKLCFGELEEEERPYEHVQEIYANVIEGLWCPLHADMKFEGDVEKKVDTILNHLIAFNHKTSWPEMTDGTPSIVFMMKHLIEKVELFDTETLASVFSGIKSSSKISHAGKLLKDYVGGGEEEMEEVEEDEEEEPEAKE